MSPSQLLLRLLLLLPLPLFVKTMPTEASGCKEDASKTMPTEASGCKEDASKKFSSSLPPIHLKICSDEPHPGQDVLVCKHEMSLNGTFMDQQSKCKLCDLECYMFDVFRKTYYDRECNCMNYSIDDKLQPESCHPYRSSRNLTIPECVPRKDTV